MWHVSVRECVSIHDVCETVCISESVHVWCVYLCVLVYVCSAVKDLELGYSLVVDHLPSIFDICSPEGIDRLTD